MNNFDFTLEDKIEALKSSGTGVWKLESDVAEKRLFQIKKAAATEDFIRM